MKTIFISNFIAILSAVILCGCASVNRQDAPNAITSGFQQTTKFAKLNDGGVTFPTDHPVTVKVATRAVDDGQEGGIYFRTFTISPDGRIISISSETDAVGVSTVQ